MCLKLLTLGLLAALITAKTININVSSTESTLDFTPASLTAESGDSIVFTFYPKDHNVVQGTYEAPCRPLDGGFYSGFVPSDEGAANTTFSVDVKDRKPIWFYCSQGRHCQGGMVGVVNPPDGKTVDTYKKLAAAVYENVSPSVEGVAGGKLGPIDSSNTTSTASGSATSSMSVSGNSTAIASTSSISTAIPKNTLVPSSAAMVRYQKPCLLAAVAAGAAAVA